MNDSATTALLQGFSLIQNIHDALEQGQAELSQAVGNPVCDSSCGKCCTRYTPMVHQIEALYVLSGYTKDVGKLKALSINWLTDPKSNTLSYGKYLNRRLSTEEQAEIGNEVKQAMSYACPFLDGTACRIYEARPIICRAYGVSLMADEWCPRKLHFTESVNKRMFISPDTPLGRDIRMRVSRFYKFLGSLNGTGAYAATSFLTTHIAEALAIDDIRKLADDKQIPDAFQAHGLVQANLFAMRPGAIVE